MTSTKKDPILVVIQLTGGNDYLNTLIPYGDPLYYDNRTNVGIPQAEVLPINDYVGLHPAASAIRVNLKEVKLWMYSHACMLQQSVVVR